jgi:2-polyprenyl-6-methoxyphenol hydroxylase-like FAD-dependent oxidoreductase
VSRAVWHADAVRDDLRTYLVEYLGDSNSSGQGASLAIESAVQLARCLRDLPDAPSAFAAYERLRRLRVEKIAARAAMANRTKAPGPVARRLIPLLMPIVMKTVMAPEKALAPVQRYQIDWTSLP